MTIKVTDAGGQRMLNILLGGTAKDTTFSMQLFCGASAPSLADTDTNATFEAPAGGVGEGAKTLSNNATVSLNGSNIPQAAWGVQTWTFTGPLTNTNKIIQGYQVLAGTVVLFEELLSTPVTPANGVSLQITPTFLLGNGVPA
jgi:hypothetical protein